MEPMISPTFESTRLQVDRVRAAYEDGMRNDNRFRQLVDSMVAMARDECGPINPEKADEAAYEQATFAAGMLLARIYDQDSELAAMRAERDQYRKQALEFANMSPMRPFVAGSFDKA